MQYVLRDILVVEKGKKKNDNLNKVKMTKKKKLCC
jgi:hypothetical protein